MMNGGGSGNGMGPIFFGPGIMGTLLVIVIVAIIAIILVLKKRANHNSTSSNKSLETLRERLARGEISEEEYERLKRKLEE